MTLQEWWAQMTGVSVPNHKTIASVFSSPPGNFGMREMLGFLKISMCHERWFLRISREI
jgi:hypothetical protein